MSNWVGPVVALLLISAIIYIFVTIRDKKHYTERSAKNGKSR